MIKYFDLGEQEIEENIDNLTADILASLNF